MNRVTEHGGTKNYFSGQISTLAPFLPRCGTRRIRDDPDPFSSLLRVYYKILELVFIRVYYKIDL